MMMMLKWHLLIAAMTPMFARPSPCCNQALPAPMYVLQSSQALSSATLAEKADLDVVACCRVVVQEVSAVAADRQRVCVAAAFPLRGAKGAAGARRRQGAALPYRVFLAAKMRPSW